MDRERILLGTRHGRPKLPWPVFRHLVDVISASGDIVVDQRLPIGSALARDGEQTVTVGCPGGGARDDEGADLDRRCVQR